MFAEVESRGRMRVGGTEALFRIGSSAGSDAEAFRSWRMDDLDLEDRAASGQQGVAFS